MGLFTSNNKTCPICGGVTPRVLPTRIEGMPLCKDCSFKVDLPDEMVNQMTMEEFRCYIGLYDENQALRESFSGTYSYNFGLLNGSLLLDAAHRLFRLKTTANAWAIKGESLKLFRIMEDDRSLFEGDATGLKCFSSDVPARVNAMSAQIAQFNMQSEFFEQVERRERRREENEWGSEDNDSYSFGSSPRFNIPGPFQNFYVEFTMDHPYWGGFRGKRQAPQFDRRRPSVEDYLRDYRENAEELHKLAVNLMKVVNPSAQEVFVTGDMPASEARTAAGGNAIEETI